MREICSKLKIKTPELEAANRAVLCKKMFLQISQILSFGHISRIARVFPLLTEQCQ